MPPQRFALPSEVPGLAARRIAADILDGVLHKHRTLDEQLDGAAAHPGLKTLSDRDRALMRRLVATILRKLGTLGHVPPWLLARWVAHYGETVARDIAVALGYDPSLDITVKSDAEQWATRLHGEILPTGSVRTLLQGSVTMLPGFTEGQWWVQDAAAALPARLFGDIAGKTIVDLCAAPGGKTAQLAQAGAIVTAVDRSPGRMTRLRDNLSRLALTAEAVVSDAVEWQGLSEAGSGGFDGILVDAPCSSTGTIRRHPDVAWLRQDGDIGALMALQKRLLQKAVSLLKPGGTLVYCTCSLEPEEGEQAVAGLLAAESSVRRVPIEAAEVAGLAEIINADGDLRTLPCHLPHADPRLGGLDGFYAARLVKS